MYIFHINCTYTFLVVNVYVYLVLQNLYFKNVILIYIIKIITENQLPDNILSFQCCSMLNYYFARSYGPIIPTNDN